MPLHGELYRSNRQLLLPYVIEVDPKWEKNNEGQVDFKAMLDEKVKWGIGFLETLRKSVLVVDISKVQGIGRKSKLEC